MSKAAESIVRGYVLLKNRKALEDLLAHREKLLNELNQVSGVDANLLLTAIREEIAVIQTGLDRLDGKAVEAVDDDRVKVLRLTASESPSMTGNDSSPTKPAADAGNQLVQPVAHEPDVESAPEQSAPRDEQNSTPIKVLGLAVSVSPAGASVAPRSAPSGSVGGLDPGSLCAPSSNEEETRRIGEGEESNTPHPTIDALKSLMSIWSSKPTKP